MGKEGKGTTPKRLAEFLPYQLSVTTNAVSHLIAREYQNRFGLKIAEWRIMAILGDVGQATQSELTDATRMDKVAVNRAVSPLVTRELVRRTPHKKDGRSHSLSLTPTGLALYHEIMPLAEQMEQRISSTLSHQEGKLLSELLKRLRMSADALSGEYDQ